MNMKDDELERERAELRRANEAKQRSLQEERRERAELQEQLQIEQLLVRNRAFQVACNLQKRSRDQTNMETRTTSTRGYGIIPRSSCGSWKHCILL